MSEKRKTNLGGPWLAKMLAAAMRSNERDPESILAYLSGGFGEEFPEGMDPMMRWTSLSPDAYKAFQAEMLAQEKSSGIPMAMQAKALTGAISDEELQKQLASMMGEGAGTAGESGGGGGLVQTGEDIVNAPILELLAEMRTRRDANSSRAQAGLEATRGLAGSLAPSKYMPGYEPQGLADIMMGILSGRGKAHGGLSEDMRAPQQLPVNLSLLDMISQPEPGIESDMPMASDLAQKILAAAMRVPRYSQASAGGSSEELAVNDYLNSILGGI